MSRVQGPGLPPDQASIVAVTTFFGRWNLAMGHFLEGAWALVLLHDYHHGRDFGSEGLDWRTTQAPVSRDNVEAVLRFLGEGDKVKATVQFRGREMSKPELGLNLLKKFTADVGDHGVAEGTPEMAGNRMHLVFGPSKKPIAPSKRPASAAGGAPAVPAAET